MVLFGYFEYLKEHKTHFLRILIAFFGILLLMKDQGLVSGHIFKKRKLEFLGLLCTNHKSCYGNKESRYVC